MLNDNCEEWAKIILCTSSWEVHSLFWYMWKAGELTDKKEGIYMHPIETVITQYLRNIMCQLEYHIPKNWTSDDVFRMLASKHGGVKDFNFTVS